VNGRLAQRKGPHRNFIPKFALVIGNLGAVVLVSNWPYTFFAIVPISNQLKAINSAGAGSKSRMLIEQWGRLHAVRSVLGFAATLVFFFASMS
jgi:hypothetical protein